MNKRIISFALFVTVAACGTVAGSQQESGNAYRQWENGPPEDMGFFPIAVWLQAPQNAVKYRQAGINTYVGLWKGPTESQLATLRKANMSVICSQNQVGLAHRDDPTIVGWMHQDEPDNAQPVVDPDTGNRTYGPPVKPQKILDLYEEMKQVDPSRPIFLNLGQGVANDEWVGRGSHGKKEDYFTYVKGCDILSFDVYPVVGIRKEDGENYLWYVAKGVDRLIRWSEGEKIVWNCIECTHISNPDKKATPHQVRAEVWMSIIHGSMGIVYFVHEFEPRFNEDALLDDPEMLAALTGLNRRIHELAPVLNSPTIQPGVKVESSNSDVPVDVMIKEFEGKVYLFSVGMRNDETNATFTLPKEYSAARVIVLGENREIRAERGKFQDRFSPYDVHIYMIERVHSGVDFGP